MRLKLLMFIAILMTFVHISFVNGAENSAIAFISIDKTLYAPKENIEMNIFNADEIQGKKTVEIISVDMGNVVYRENINSTLSEISIEAPSNSGEYILKVYLDSEEYSKKFTVEGDSELFVLTGEILKNNLNNIVGIELKWNFQSENKYKIIRSENGTESEIFENITSNSFIDVSIEPNKVYEYTVFGESGKSNKVIIDVSQFKNSEYIENNNKNCIALRVGDPYMNHNGKEKKIDKSGSIYPVIINGMALLPIRTVVETMGGSADWNETEKLVSLKAWNNIVEIPVGKNEIRVNGSSARFDVPAVIISSRIFIPVRHLESLGCEVNWIEETKRIVIKY